jgi:hypothetical protein
MIAMFGSEELCENYFKLIIHPLEEVYNTSCLLFTMIKDNLKQGFLVAPSKSLA